MIDKDLIFSLKEFGLICTLEFSIYIYFLISIIFYDKYYKEKKCNKK